MVMWRDIVDDWTEGTGYCLMELAVFAFIGIVGRWDGVCGDSMKVVGG